MLTQKSKSEFDTARQRAAIEEWLSAFTGKSDELLSFEEVRDTLHLQDSSYKGLQEIELDKIIGSVGRYRDFSRTFLPKGSVAESRWRQVDEIAGTQGYPPIEVYKVGEAYFVRDGNHRVSVARLHETPTIEAFVIEYKSPVPINKDDDMDSIFLKIDQADFLAETKLDQIRPSHQVAFTEPGRYRSVKQHIAFHKYLKERELERELSQDEAVASWYDTVYLPIIHLIREEALLDEFPGRTEADLYVWFLHHRASLEERISDIGYVPPETIWDEVMMEEAPNPLTRLLSYFRYQANLNRMPLEVARAKFLKMTGLNETRPEHQIKFSEPDNYKQAQEHIWVHKYLREAEQHVSFTDQEAASSWYDTVYLPIIQLVRERQINRYFPGNTEADFYIWLVTHRAILEEQHHTLGQVSDEALIAELEREGQAGAWTRWIPFFRRRLEV